MLRAETLNILMMVPVILPEGEKYNFEVRERGLFTALGGGGGGGYAG